MRLSAKERGFVSEYLIDRNGTQAAERAGYSKKTARQLASRLLSKVHIQEAIAEALKKAETKNEITAERLDRALLSIAEADIRKAFNADGTPRPIHEIPDDVAKAIAGVDMNDVTGEIVRFRFVEKTRPLEILLKRRRLLTDLHEHTGKNGVPLVPTAPEIGLLQKLTLPELKRLANMRNGTEATH